MKAYKTGNRTAGSIGLIIMTAAAFLLVVYSDRIYEWITELTQKNISYADGIYEGEGQGYAGAIRAIVTIREGQIAEVHLEGEEETPELGGRALEKMPRAILEKQSPEVDGISGATMTSGGIRDAVRNALKEAEEK